jgi:hypothetical protein
MKRFKLFNYNIKGFNFIVGIPSLSQSAKYQPNLSNELATLQMTNGGINESQFQLRNDFSL